MTRIGKILSMGAALGFVCNMYGQQNASDIDASVMPTGTNILSHNIKDMWTDRESLFLEDLQAEYLSDTGFSPVLMWTGENWNNVSGGLATGTTWNSLFTIGIEQNLGKLAGKSNLGTFGVSAFYYVSSGDFDGEYLGALSSPSNIFSSDMIRVFEIYYKNSFETEYGTYSFRMGQLAADEDFMCLEYSDVFLNSSFGAIPTNAANSLANGTWAFSQYALATLAASAIAEYEDFEFRLGVYNGTAGRDISSNNGFSYDLQGLALWYQAGYNYAVLGLSGKVIFGGNYNSNQFLNYETDESSRNFYSFFMGLQQDILADEEGHAILGAFCRVAWAPDESVSDYTKYIDAGLNWFAPIAGRNDDIFAIGVSAMEVGSAYRRAEDMNRYDTMMEVTYRCRITKAITLQPSFQIYFDTKDADGNDKTAYVVGVRAEVNF